MPDSQERINAIGGYFELTLPKAEPVMPYGDAYRYQSARAAFRALLCSNPPSKVWMPKFICDAMLQPLLEEKVKVGWYDLEEGLEVQKDLIVGETEWVLYVNYFGLCDSAVNRILVRFPPEQVVLDYSQAFFCEPRAGALATIYSPRKFFGVPDGGLLMTKRPIKKPVASDVSSLARMTHLLKRIFASPESGYAAYQEAESSLNDCEPKGMSVLTSKLLDSIDYDFCKKKRVENFRYLHQKLGPFNEFKWEGDLSLNAPLCYPFKTRKIELKQHLIAERIFVPTYWNDALERLNDTQASILVNGLLPLPIDHRYGSDEMDRMIGLILEKLA